jgi:hypothetical protein
MTYTQESATVKMQDEEKVAVALEIAWGNVFRIINHFISQHDQLGFKLIKEKSDPRIEDMLLSLKVMGAILNILDNMLSNVTEQRMLLNAKQQIILFERASLAVQGGDENEYSEAVQTMRNQAQF